MSKVINEKDVERFKKTINKEKDFLAKSLTKETKIETYVQALYLGYLDASRTFGGQKKVTTHEKNTRFPYDISVRGDGSRRTGFQDLRPAICGEFQPQRHAYRKTQAEELRRERQPPHHPYRVR